MHFIDRIYIQKTGYELKLHKPFPLGYPVLRPKGKRSFQISPDVFDNPLTTSHSHGVG